MSKEHERERAGLARQAKKINAEHLAVEKAAAAGLEHAQLAGQLLSEVRETLELGEWEPWVAEHLAFSLRTAQTYLRVWERREDIAEAQRAAPDMSLRAALQLLTEPREEEEEPPAPTGAAAALLAEYAAMPTTEARVEASTAAGEAVAAENRRAGQKDALAAMIRALRKAVKLGQQVGPEADQAIDHVEIAIRLLTAPAAGADAA